MDGRKFEFLLDDLKDEARERFIEFLGGDNGNHDVIPFCTYELADENVTYSLDGDTDAK